MMRALAAVLLLLVAPAAGAQERILSFDSDIVISSDAVLNVTETIRVQSEGRNIRRGIFRDFPTDYRDRLGNRYRVTFNLRRVTRDGAGEPARLERRSNGVRIYIGSADRLLPPGIYTYQIQYETTRQLGFFAAHDELYWNVTGNGWQFPIEEARARIKLPAGIDRNAITVEGYTGAAGSAGRDYEAAVALDGAVRIMANKRLRAREGLTLVVTWPKGFVTAPSATQRLGYLFSDNLGLLVVALAGLLSFSYLGYAWHRVGRDPAPGVIFPHYEPPTGFSPASLRFVQRMGYDSKAFTAALLNLAVKGLVEITENDGDYTVRRLTPPTGSKLASGEAALLGSLFRGRDRLELKDDNYEVIQTAMAAHKAALARHYKRTHFITNRLVNIPAWLIFALSAGVLLVLGRGSPLIFVILGLMVVGFLIFAVLLQAHTQLGRRLLDKVEGFKMYLEVAEQDDLNLRNPPEKTPALFETYLPFALALGVEQPWADQFADVFARLATETGQTYEPRWYRGDFDSSNLGDFAADMGGALNSAISSASTPPGSSSGSGGGGFSGGGGGGGGGGGW